MKYNRIQEIESYLRAVKSATNEDLMERFQVSMQTLRRDIKELEEKQFLKKIYGGVVLLQDDTWQGTMLDISSRNSTNQEKKQKIGQQAAALVEDHDVIFVDSGTTAFHLIPFLAARQGVTVISHSLHVMCALSEMTNLKAICLGGVYSPQTGTFIADTSAYQYNYSKAFISTVGISINKGLTNTDFQEGIMKRHAIEHANDVYLLCDSSKFGNVAFHHFADILDVHTIITDTKPDDKFLNFFRKLKIKVLFE